MKVKQRYWKFMKFTDSDKENIVYICDYCLESFNKIRQFEEFSTSTKYCFNLCLKCCKQFSYEYFGYETKDPDSLEVRIITRKHIFNPVHKFKVKCELSKMKSNGWIHIIHGDEI